VEIIRDKGHSSNEGLNKIVSIVSAMNLALSSKVKQATLSWSSLEPITRPAFVFSTYFLYTVLFYILRNIE